MLKKDTIWDLLVFWIFKTQFSGQWVSLRPVRSYSKSGAWLLAGDVEHTTHCHLQTVHFNRAL